MKSIHWILCLVLALSSCARKMNPGGGFSSRYHQLLRSLTREQKLFGIEKVYYKTSVVHRTCDLRKAYVDEYSEAYHLRPEETKSMLDEELADCEKYDVFVVSHFASDHETQKLDKIRGVWKVSLGPGKNRETTLDPSIVSSLPGPRPVIYYFYPFITPWSKNYVIKFPKMSDASRLTLYMDGVEHNVKFAW